MYSKLLPTKLTEVIVKPIQRYFMMLLFSLVEVYYISSPKAEENESTAHPLYFRCGNCLQAETTLPDSIQEPLLYLSTISVSTGIMKRYTLIIVIIWWISIHPTILQHNYKRQSWLLNHKRSPFWIFVCSRRDSDSNVCQTWHRGPMESNLGMHVRMIVTTRQNGISITETFIHNCVCKIPFLSFSFHI